MAASEHSPIEKEISQLAIFVSIPQIIASPIIEGISHFIYPKNVAFEVMDILDFLVVSFPLTLSVAVITVLIAKGQFNLFSLFIAIVGAALLSNLLHTIIGKIPSVNIRDSFNETFTDPANRGSDNLLILWIFKIFGIYWKNSGPLMFIQSCCIGIYAADKFLRIEKNKKAKK